MFVNLHHETNVHFYMIVAVVPWWKLNFFQTLGSGQMNIYFNSGKANICLKLKDEFTGSHCKILWGMFFATRVPDFQCVFCLQLIVLGFTWTMMK